MTVESEQRSARGKTAAFYGTAMALFAAAGGAEAQETRLAFADVADEIFVEGKNSSYKLEADSPKYTADLIDTPRAITVIGEDVIRDMAASSLTDALRTVPGITMAMGEGGQPFSDRPFIRGSESTSGLLVDGLRDSSAQSRDVYNLEQIEVAKGPNGAFAGRGAPGGSINLVTKKANAETAISGLLRGGNADQKRGEADLNYAVTDNFAVRLNGMWQESEIPGRDAVFDDRWGIAPSVTWGLSGPTRITASYEHYEGDGLIDYGHPLDPVTGEPIDDIDPDNFYGLVARDFNRTELDSGLLTISHQLRDNIMIRNITRYAESSTDYIASNPDDSQGNVVNGLVVRNVKSNNSNNETFVNQTDLTAQFQTGGIEHSIAMGFEVANEKTVRATYSVEQVDADGDPIPRGGCDLVGAGAPSGYNCTDLYNPDPYDPWVGAISLNDPTTTEADTLGAYIFDTITVTERLLINLGLRWDKFDTETSTGLANKDDFLTYQAGLVYKPTENSSLYASYGTSTSPSGVTAGDGGENINTRNEDLEPEKGRNYEIGAKAEFFEKRLALNAALFRTEIVDDHVATAAGRGAPQEAIGKTRVQGLEVSATGQILATWNVFAGYSYLDSEIIDAGPVNTASEGNKLPNTPEHSFSLWTTYQPVERFSLGGGANYVSERFGNTDNTKRVDGYVRFDAMAAYAVTDNIALQLNVQNLTDKRYYERVYTTHMATVAPGRSITGTLRFSF